jgi:hypothetical protein
MEFVYEVSVWGWDGLSGGMEGDTWRCNKKIKI